MDFPDVPPGTTVRAVRTMKYITLQDLREIAPPGSPESADLRHEETYDPATQAVVMASIEGQTPISIKLRLEPPNLVEEPGGVQ